MSASFKNLATASVDCSQILTHLIRAREGQQPKEILKKILGLKPYGGTPLLKASSTGYYLHGSSKVYTPEAKGYNAPDSKAVCFTESTLQGLEAHNEIYKADYGLAFRRDTLFAKGANPAINIRESLLSREVGCLVSGASYNALKNHIPATLAPFVNVIREDFDATYEREWRFAGDLRFSTSDLFILFCPEKEFEEFEGVQANAMPVLFDLKWLKFV